MFGINFEEHASRPNLYVFNFTEEERAAYFERLLGEQQISFEKERATIEGQETIFYGIKKQDFPAAKKINYLVFAKFRKPFIADPIARYALVILTFGAILLALIGYLLS